MTPLCLSCEDEINDGEPPLVWQLRTLLALYLIL